MEISVENSLYTHHPFGNRAWYSPSPGLSLGHAGKTSSVASARAFTFSPTISSRMWNAAWERKRSSYLPAFNCHGPHEPHRLYIKLPAPIPPSGVPFLARVVVLRPMRSPVSFDLSGSNSIFGRLPTGLLQAQGGMFHPFESSPVVFAVFVSCFTLPARPVLAIARGAAAASRPTAEEARKKVRLVRSFSFIVPSHELQCNLCFPRRCSGRAHGRRQIIEYVWRNQS